MFEVFGDEGLDEFDLLEVGRMHLDQEVVELGGDLVGVLRDERRGTDPPRRIASTIAGRGG